MEAPVEARYTVARMATRTAPLGSQMPEIMDFAGIDKAEFGPMYLATVGLDADHTAYVLVPKDWLESQPV